MSLKHNIDGDELNIKVEGRFTHDQKDDFLSIIDNFKQDTISLVSIELQDTKYIDSSALGMLLQLNEEAKKRSSVMILKHPQGQVKRLFEFSQIDSHIEIVE